jgi:hypothetical protein
MDTLAGRPSLAVSILWRFGLALLFGTLVGALGGMSASALSQGLLLAALLARPVLQFSSLRRWWQAAPRSKRGHRGFELAITIVSFVLFTIPTFFWEVTGLVGMHLGLGSPALLSGLAASMLFGINERSLGAFAAAIAFGTTAGLGALLGFMIISPPSVLTFQVAAVALLLAAGGGLVGALIWLVVRYIAQSGKAETLSPDNQPALAPTIDEAAIAPQQQLSRRAVLVGAAKGAGLFAVGAGMTWATRALVPQFLPLYVYRGHTGFVQAVAWSPDGSLIASAARDKTVQVWKPFQPTAPVLVYRGHSGIVFSLAWSPDGTRIASAGIDGTTQIWDAHTGAHLLTYPHGVVLPQSANALAWSPNGASLALVVEDIHVWSASTGHLRLSYSGHSDGGGQRRRLVARWHTPGLRWRRPDGADLGRYDGNDPCYHAHRSDCL